MNKKSIYFIVGPTAVGKSSLALKLAEKINGEIISADSMQVYREIDIASNKPSQKELEVVKHHLVNCVSVENDFDVSQFNDLANSALSEILERGNVPIVCGGSGLYVNVLLDGLFEGNPSDDQLRENLYQDAKKLGNQKLHDRLAELDPVSAKNIHPNNTKRVVRALEICLLNQKPKSEIQQKRSGWWDQYEIKYVGLDMDRDKLYSKINERVEQMVKQGLENEIRRLEDLNLSQTSRELIGVKELLGFFKNEYDFARAIELMKQNTRHLAKRQWTWFRKDERIKWFDVEHQNDAMEYLCRI